MSPSIEMNMQKTSLLLLLLLALSLSLPARADTAKARDLYIRGTRAYNLQKFEQALALFQQAYEQKDDPAILFNIAQCQRQLGQYEAAAKSYRAYLAQDPKTHNREDVEARIADMDRAAHEQRARLPPNGTEPPSERSTSTTSNTTTNTNTYPASNTSGNTGGTSATVTTTAPARGSRTLRLAGIGVGAGGLVLVALGGAFAGLSKSAGDTAYHSPVYDPDADDRQKSFRAGDIACFAIGGAAVVAGVTLYVLGVRQ
jgi:tetratricopeptide (TPR) repeat protein